MRALLRRLLGRRPWRPERPLEDARRERDARILLGAAPHGGQTYE